MTIKLVQHILTNHIMEQDMCSPLCQIFDKSHRGKNRITLCWTSGRTPMSNKCRASQKIDLLNFCTFQYKIVFLYDGHSDNNLLLLAFHKKVSCVCVRDPDDEATRKEVKTGTQLFLSHTFTVKKFSLDKDRQLYAGLR